MKCQKCVGECKARGELCGPRDPDHAQYYEPWMYEAEKEHRRTAHAMALCGALWKCSNGHEIEATPQETMRAAGIKPML